MQELLACPACRAALRSTAQEMACQREECGRRYPIVNGVPVLLTEPDRCRVEHEARLDERPGYSRWKERIVLKSLTDAQVALDFGAGRNALDDPCIIKMDVTLNPYVDLVGDVHMLPFRDASVDFAFGGAVFEHLADPWRAVEELWRVLKPGGYVYADWNFVFAYHGYPHHYFNASPHAVENVFRRFTKLGAGVAPFHAPSFALRSVLGTYLEIFRPRADLERELAADLTRVLQYPLERFNAAIPQDDWFRVAAGYYFFGIKQPTGVESVIPPVVLEAYRDSEDLQRRFPRPLDLSVPDNLMIWATTEGRDRPAVDAFFRNLRPFTKREGLSDRAVVRGWPLELMTEPDALPGADRNALLLEAGRPWRRRLRETWERGGLAGVARRAMTGLGRRVGWHRD